jgi:5-(carboxyamino)imidazole ribonucleotide mutase
MTVAVVMGSDSDLPVMVAAIETLHGLDIAVEVRVVSAHRDPEGMLDFASRAQGRGVMVIIAGAGGAAHLPGMIAAATPLPVIGVPVGRPHLDGLDSLLSIVQMPAGIPVATMAIDGAENAALLAARILALSDPAVALAVTEHQAGLRRAVVIRNDRVQAEVTLRGRGTPPEA